MKRLLSVIGIVVGVVLVVAFRDTTIGWFDGWALGVLLAGLGLVELYNTSRRRGSGSGGSGGSGESGESGGGSIREALGKEVRDALGIKPSDRGRRADRSDEGTP